jgi:flagellar hook-length control protein FliK
VAGRGTEAPPIHAAGTAAPAEAGTSGRPTPNGAHGGSTERARDGFGDAANATTTTAFSRGGNDQQPLDLGTPERSQAFVVAGKAATALTTATAPGYEGEQIRTTTAPTGGGAGGAPTALPPAAITGSPQNGALGRTEPAAQHPTGIEARWGERVVDALRLSAVRGGGEIRLQLEPAGLGHIDVRLHLQPDGVRAVIVAEHESTRALLTSQQHVLQDAFNRSDLRLSGFSVDVGSGGGAATFGRGGEAGEGGSAPPLPAAPLPAAEALEATAAPLANGRVNVRV